MLPKGVRITELGAVNKESHSSKDPDPHPQVEVLDPSKVVKESKEKTTSPLCLKRQKHAIFPSPRHNHMCVTLLWGNGLVWRCNKATDSRITRTCDGGIRRCGKEGLSFRSGTLLPPRELYQLGRRKKKRLLAHKSKGDHDV